VLTAAEKHAAQKAEVFAHYGQTCRCCGGLDHLGVDHIHGDGGQHMQEIGGAHRFYSWLIRHEFPPGFQTLCSACNTAKGKDACCPLDHGQPASPFTAGQSPPRLTPEDLQRRVLSVAGMARYQPPDGCECGACGDGGRARREDAERRLPGRAVAAWITAGNDSRNVEPVVTEFNGRRYVVLYERDVALVVYRVRDNGHLMVKRRPPRALVSGRAGQS